MPWLLLIIKLKRTSSTYILGLKQYMCSVKFVMSKIKAKVKISHIFKEEHPSVYLMSRTRLHTKKKETGNGVIPRCGTNIDGVYTIIVHTY
jgi:hypothetical protein